MPENVTIDELEYGDRATASELVGYVQWGQRHKGGPMRAAWWEPYLANMVRKHAKGNYDPALAVKGARHGADYAAKEYFGHAPDWHRSADTRVRQAVAVELAAIVTEGLASGLTSDTVGGYLSEDDGWAAS
jgi:hypothetical protein